MEEGIALAITPENSRNLTTETDLLSNSFDYWSALWYNGVTGSTQNFLNDKTSTLLSVQPNSLSNSGYYIGSPMIKLDSSKNNKLYFKKTTFFIRHMWIFNGEGKVLFSIGSGNGTAGPTIFYGGLSNSDIKKFISDENNISSYPLLCSSLSVSQIQFNAGTLKELNLLYQNDKGDESYIGSYIENEPVWICFNTSNTTRPSSEDDYDAWVHKVSDYVQCIESASYEVFEIPSLAISDRVANKYYNSSRLDNVIDEIGEFKKALAIKNKVLKTTKKTVAIYSKDRYAGFFVEAYNGHYLSSNSKLTSPTIPTYTSLASYKNYQITIPIPIDFSDEGNIYKISGIMRHFHLYDSNGDSVYYGQNVSNIELNIDYCENTLGINPLQVKYLSISVPPAYASNLSITHINISTFYSFNMPSLVLTDDQLGGIDLSGIGDGYKEVTLSDVDRIVAIGDSYTESHYTIKDKSWISKVSLLSDYNYDNFAISGDTYRGQLNKIRTGTYAYASASGMTWEKLHPTHAIMISKTNDTKYMDAQQFIYDMIATIETIKGLGAIPIIATEYHVSSQNYTQTAFDYYAKKYGGYYIDLTEKVYTLRGSDYAPFWGGSHPGTRTNHLFSDIITEYINKNLPRPYSAIKIFRARDNSLISNLDNYLFHGVEERAEKFKEISVCHSALTDSSLYDNCTNKSNSKVESEYFKLMSGINVEFDKICLIDVILPTTIHDISEVKLITNELANVSCYVKDVMAEPYPSPAFCRRFDIAQVLDNTHVAVGNKYTSNKSTGSTYTVVEIIYDQVESDNGFVDGTILICSGNKSTTAYNSSTLTLTSGTGDSTLLCSYEAVGLSSDYPAGKQDIGHYVLLEEYGVVNGSTLKRAMDCDKITFLLISDSTFNLNTVSVKFKGNITKTRDTLSYHNSLIENNINKTSILTYKKFDSDNIGHWLHNDSTACGLVPEVPVDNVLPKNISSIITLAPENGTIVQSFTPAINVGGTISSNYKVRIWARYFPDVFDATTMNYPDDSQITDDSFDWAKLSIKLYDTNSSLSKDLSIKMEKLVGLHWTELEFDITIPPNNNTWYLGIESIDKPIQLAYVDII